MKILVYSGKVAKSAILYLAKLNQNLVTQVAGKSPQNIVHNLPKDRFAVYSFFFFSLNYKYAF